MYIPKHSHWAIPVSIILLGFAIRERFGDTYDVIITMLCLQATGIMHGIYIWKAGLLYQAYVTHAPLKQDDTEPIYNKDTGKVVEEAKPRSDGFTPLVRLNGQPAVLNQVVSLPRFDCERNFARALIAMRNSNLDINMTESYWIKGKRFGESRDRFVEMLDKWEYYGLSGREGGQGKRVPKDWRKIRLVEQGERLPPPPRKVL